MRQNVAHPFQSDDYRFKKDFCNSSATEKMDWSTNHPNKFVNRGSQDSAIGSHKSSFSFQDSQGSELSQVATQDVFSQNIATPQPEISKPMSMYEKWKNRQSMMKREGVSPQGMVLSQAGSAPGSSKKMPLLSLGRWDSKTSLNSLPSTTYISSLRRKPDDNDERKVMDQLVTIIKDCNNEVKSTLLYLMENMEKITDVSNGQFEKNMSSFLERIWIHEEAIKKLIEEHGTKACVQNELEANLAKKDCQISTLKGQLAEATKDTSQKWTEALRSEMRLFQAAVMDKLEKSRQPKEKHQYDFITDCLDTIHEQQKKNEGFWKSLKSGMKDSEKRIIDGVSKSLQKTESKILSQEKDCCKEFKNLTEMNKRDIQKCKMIDAVEKQDLDHWTRSLENTIEVQFKEMVHTLEQIITREIKMIDKEGNTSTHNQDFSGCKRSHSNHVPSKMPPLFIGPFQNQTQPFAMRKGPSPYAVVAPQRKAPSDKTSELKISSHLAKPRKRRKSVYNDKKCSSKKKCIIEGLSCNRNESPCNFRNMNSISSHTKDKTNLQQGSNLRKNSLRSHNSQDSRNNQQMNSAIRKALDAYNFDEPDTQNIASKPMIKLQHNSVPRLQTASYAGSQLDLKKPGTFSNAFNENKETPMLKKLVKDQSPLSSPSISVVDITFHRKVKTPFRGFHFRKEQRDLGPKHFKAPFTNWHSNMNPSQSKTLLSDVT
ncbi:hypothetical protein PoB_004827700 [Plakobranchus ocellatus]|uniref:Uncharacterized protein n=1 Tax=Plakobranchus ocellatus TaxID=259542 RepID=A0AAV4BQX8_9GAST|nr:hypothetical protein PoB_004827700 [Plakobranchus ocellatus]